LSKKKNEMVHVKITATVYGKVVKESEGNIKKKDIGWLALCEDEIRQKIVKLSYEITPIP
jgi:hypothetical protein